MKPETWHTIAAVLLTAGILLLIAAIICSVRFRFISMIRAELNNRKEQQNADKKDYFRQVETNRIETLPDLPAEIPEHTKTEQHTPAAVPAGATVPAARRAGSSPEPRTGTVPVGRRQQERTESGTLVISARRRHGAQTQPAEQEQAFAVTDCILVMCGDPDAVSRFRNATRKGIRHE